MNGSITATLFQAQGVWAVEDHVVANKSSDISLVPGILTKYSNGLALQSVRSGWRYGVSFLSVHPERAAG